MTGSNSFAIWGAAAFLQNSLVGLGLRVSYAVVVCLLAILRTAGQVLELRKWRAVLPSSFEPPSDALLTLLGNVGRDWVASEKPLGTRVAADGGKLMSRVSAGVTSHPATTHAALDDIFAFLDRAAARRKRARG